MTYESEPGLLVQAYLLRPVEPGRDRPAAVVLHSTVNWTIRGPAGLEGPPELHIALHLARRGYVTFCPRNFIWEHGGVGNDDPAVQWLRKRHPGATGMAKMLFDASRAVDLLAAQPDVNPRRVGAIGHSLGAKETLYLAAFDERVRAAVSSEGGIGMTFSNWDAPWYLGAAIRPRLFAGPCPGARAVRSPPFSVDWRRIGRRRPELAFCCRGDPSVEAHRRPASHRSVQSSSRTCLPRRRRNPPLRVAGLVPAGVKQCRPPQNLDDQGAKSQKAAIKIKNPPRTRERHGHGQFRVFAVSCCRDRFDLIPTQFASRTSSRR